MADRVLYYSTLRFKPIYSIVQLKQKLALAILLYYGYKNYSMA